MAGITLERRSRGGAMDGGSGVCSYGTLAHYLMNGGHKKNKRLTTSR